jgi:PAS domain S-box-containing protein
LRHGKNRTITAVDIELKRTVTLLLHSNYYVLSGEWSWDLYAVELFCSDVILSSLPETSGIRTVIHPDDTETLYELVAQQPTTINEIEFRVITTYGEVKTVAGYGISLMEHERSVEELAENVRTSYSREIELSQLKQQLAVYTAAEKINDTGSWYYNASTHETWFSDQLFRLHDLQPQTLNSHFYTFIPFVHPEERDQVHAFIEQAYKKRLSLELEFRIVTAGREKLVSYISSWTFNEKGESIVTGIYKDITREKQLEERLEFAEDAVAFHKQVLHFDEQQLHTGHWQVNLMTRKLSFTDNFFRLFGLKPQGLPSGIKMIANYIHPDDREGFLLSVKKMFNSHLPPELSYRVLRSDGKLRQIMQKGKLVSVGEELIMTCTVQDVTVKKSLEKKIAELNETLLVKERSVIQAESLRRSGSWIWNMTTGDISWSEGLYNLFSLKPGTFQLTQKRLLLLVHPEDKKKFTDELELVLLDKQPKTIQFRSVAKGMVRYMKAMFAVTTTEQTEYFIGQLFDITPETSLQNTLYERVQLAESLSENILDRVIITDTNNNILLWNKHSEQYFNIKREEATGKHFFDILPKLKTEEQVRLFDRVLKGESIHLTDQRSAIGKGYCDIHMMPVWSSEELEVTGIIHIIHDITKEYELKRSLNDRLNFIESLVDASVDRIIVLDKNMCYLAWNKKCEDEYGWKKEDVLGKNVLDLFPGWQDELAYTHFRKALTGETVHLLPDAGKGRDYEVYLIPVKNERNEIFAVLWVMHDFEAEYQLEYQKKKNLQVLNSLEECYIELDHDYRFVFMNDSTGRFLKVEPEKYIGQVVWDVLPRTANTRMKEAIIKVMEDHIPVRGEFVSPTKQSRIFVSVTPTDEGISIIFVDIEEQKENELRLQEREDLINQVTYATPDSITIYDLENKEPLYLNNRLSEWLGYSNEELISMGDPGRQQLFHPDDRVKMIVFNQQMNDSPDDEIHTIEYTVISREGKPIRIRNRSKVFRRNEAAKAVKILSVLQRLDTN